MANGRNNGNPLADAVVGLVATGVFSWGGITAYLQLIGRLDDFGELLDMNPLAATGVAAALATSTTALCFCIGPAGREFNDAAARALDRIFGGRRGAAVAPLVGGVVPAVALQPAAPLGVGAVRAAVVPPPAIPDVGARIHAAQLNPVLPDVERGGLGR